MKTEVHYYRVEANEAAFTWLGGPIKPGGPGMVWLCNPGGDPVLEVSAACVKPSSRAEIARRIIEDRRASKAPLN